MLLLTLFEPVVIVLCRFRIYHHSTCAGTTRRHLAQWCATRRWLCPRRSRWNGRLYWGRGMYTLDWSSVCIWSSNLWSVMDVRCCTFSSSSCCLTCWSCCRKHSFVIRVAMTVPKLSPATSSEVSCHSQLLDWFRCRRCTCVSSLLLSCQVTWGTPCL